MGFDPVPGGYRLAEVRSVDMHVKSIVATHGKDGMRSYPRTPADYKRTVNHEGDHRSHNHQWYNNNEKELLKTLNGANGTIYKDTKEAEKALNKLIDNSSSYGKFHEQEVRHEGPNWPNYKKNSINCQRRAKPLANRLNRQPSQWPGAKSFAEYFEYQFSIFGRGVDPGAFRSARNMRLDRLRMNRGIVGAVACFARHESARRLAARRGPFQFEPI